MGLNVLIFGGRVGAVPVVTQVGDRKKAVIRVASTEKFMSKGEKKENTTWLDVEFWGRQAEVLEEYITVGQEISCVGRLEIRSWEKDGQKYYHTGMVANSFEFGSKPKGASGGMEPKALEELLRKAMKLKDAGVDEDSAVTVILQAMS